MAGADARADADAGANADADAGANADADAGANADADAGANADADVDVADTAGLDAMDLVETSGYTVIWSNNFDSPSEEGQWSFTNTSGFDDNTGLAHSPPNDGWVNTGVLSQPVWNAINTVQNTGYGNSICRVQAYINASDAVVQGLAKLDVWDAYGDFSKPLADTVIAAGDDRTYVLYVTPEFVPPPSDEVVIDFGIWGPTNNQWIRIDDVVLQCSTQ
jgi:hypothetical protein